MTYLPSQESTEETINQFITNTVKYKEPDTIEQLVQAIHKEFSISEKEAMKYIVDLNSKGKLKLEDISFPQTGKGYLFSTKAAWYWIIVLLSTATIISVYTIPGDAIPMVYVRYLLGSGFVLFLPGFCLIKALFPKKELDNFERIGLSVGMSLAIVALTSFLLSYTAWGITTTTVTISFTSLTVAFASIALLREQGQNKKIDPQHL